MITTMKRLTLLFEKLISWERSYLSKNYDNFLKKYMDSS